MAPKLMNHFYQSVDGWFNFRDIYDTALREAVDGAVFVEVGSWYGRSAAYMAVEIANSGKRIDFYCVDTWRGSPDSPWMAEHLAAKGGSAFPFFRDNLERGGVWHLVKILEEPSVAAALHFAPSSVDFVMIDGAHDYANVRADVSAWLPRVKPDGVIAGDDSNWPGVMIGVYDAIPASEVITTNGGANWTHRKRRPERGFWARRRPSDVLSDYLAFIPCVNRLDLLDQAVESVQRLWPSLVVVDQTPDGLQSSDHPWMNYIGGVFRVTTPDLSFTQVMNWAQAEACERGADFLVFMHNDAECIGSVSVQVLEHARQHPNAGVVFTNYDAYSVFRVSALQDVGPWDETFRWYFSDTDYYFRMRLRGWKAEDFGSDSVIHHTSQTLQFDGALLQQVGLDSKWNEDHYRHKWGGPPGSERYDVPYNGRAW